MDTEDSPDNPTKSIHALESENALLKARLYNMGRENGDLKKQLADIRQELKETQALLGQAVVAESLNQQKSESAEVRVLGPASGPSRVFKRRFEIRRSPSIEIIEVSGLQKEEPLTAALLKTELPVPVVKQTQPATVKSESAIHVKAESTQQPVKEEDVTHRTKRRKLDPESLHPESHTINTIVIDLTLEEERDDRTPAPGPSSLTTEVKREVSENQIRGEQPLSQKKSIPANCDINRPPCVVEATTHSNQESAASTSNNRSSNQATATATASTSEISRVDHAPNDRTMGTPSTAANLEVKRGVTANQRIRPTSKVEASVSEKRASGQMPDEVKSITAPTHQAPSGTGAQGLTNSSNSGSASDQTAASSLVIAGSSREISRIQPTRYRLRAHNSHVPLSQNAPSSTAVHGTSSSSASGVCSEQPTASISALPGPMANTTNSTGKQAFNLSPSVVNTYLQSTIPLEINPPPLNIEVSRAFLRMAYGGSDRTFLQYFSAYRNPSGYSRRCVVFPMLSLNPAMPSCPGMPGLVFASRHEILENLPWTVFCKRSSAAPAVWLYLGEYENTLVGVMTSEQFRSQALQVQREWATSLLQCKQFDVYVAMRARIALRKAGLLPVTGNLTDEEKEKEEKALIEDEMLEIKCEQGMPLDRDDIVTAFGKGEEAIDIIRMRCVKYDHIFANDMKEKLPQYSGLLAANKRRTALRARNTRKNNAKSKKEHQPSTSPSEDDYDEDSDTHCYT